MISDWKAAALTKAGASVTPGRAFQSPSKGQAARQTTSPDVCAPLRQSLAPTPTIAQEPPATKALDFHPSGGADSGWPGCSVAPAAGAAARPCGRGGCSRIRRTAGATRQR